MRGNLETSGPEWRGAAARGDEANGPDPVSHPRVTGWRPRPSFPPLKPVQAICPSRAAVQPVTVDTFAGGRGGGGVRLNCQPLKGPPRPSREAALGVSAGSSAGSGGRMKGLEGSEGLVVGGERGDFKRVSSCWGQGQACPFCSRFLGPWRGPPEPIHSGPGSQSWTKLRR